MMDTDYNKNNSTQMLAVDTGTTKRHASHKCQCFLHCERLGRHRHIMLIGVISLFLFGSVLGQGRITSREASFYGESYVYLPVEDATSSSHLTLDFRSQLPHGLLLLAAGTTDYVLLQLNAGELEARVNLGSGEAVTFSARGVRLDNSRWHSVVINRTLDRVYLSVDGLEQGQASTPGTYHDLNIDLGVVLGGHGSMTKEVYKKTKPFRGCMRNVVFNGHDILKEAQDLRSAQNAFQIGWKCDEIFSASSTLPISFQADSSFVAFPFLRVHHKSKGLFSCEFKTRSEKAVILFNCGQGSAWEDFIAVELVGGRPKLSTNKGSGVVEVVIDQPVNDGLWHTMEVGVSDSVAQLTVDEQSNLTRFHLGGQNYLNLAGHLYVGGLGFQIRSQARRLGLASLENGASMKGSMEGCIRDIRMNSRVYGFQQIQSSRLIKPDCDWAFPCAQDPCLSSARCTEVDRSNFECQCDLDECVKDDFQPGRKNQVDPNAQSVVSVTEAKVSRGGRVVINANIVHINQPTGAGSSVQFYVKTRPREGVVDIRRRTGGSGAMFTLDDLQRGNVVYRHYGGRTVVDSIGVEMVVTGPVGREKYDFIIPIRIASNPKGMLTVTLPFGNVIPVTDGAKIEISPSILGIKSSTSADLSRLKFVISFLRSASSTFELSSKPGTSVTSFSPKDMQEGLVWFQHRGDRVVYTRVNVTDGESVSEAVDLRFRQEKLSLRVTNNTGVLVRYGQSVPITAHNLTIVTNSPFEQLQISYGLSAPPAHGVLQTRDGVKDDLSTASVWADVETFTQEQINNGLLRYLHTPVGALASHDSFTFEVEAKDAMLPPHAFNVRFGSVSLKVAHEEDLSLAGVSYGKFSPRTLLVQSESDKSDIESVVYSLLRAPHRGNLYLFKQVIISETVFSRLPSLRVNDSFTQKDINSGYLYYKLKSPSTESVRDFLDLQASYFGFTIRVPVVVEYSPSSPTDLEVTNKGLRDVPEGGSLLITEDDLSAQMAGYSDFTFTILRTPTAGRIEVVSTDRSNASVFTLKEIRSGRVMYKHDDSETSQDSFTYLASQIFDGIPRADRDKIEEVRGTFKISIMMKNDNIPVRTVKKVFKVARGQTKTLTIEDLAFHDPDVDFDDALLVYHCQPISNGELLKSGQVVYNFTQEELMTKALLFHHQGDVYGRTTITVTDGEFTTNALFEIQASPPYVALERNTGLTVERGHHAAISSDVLTIESNVQSTPEQIKFEVLQPPKHGQLRIKKKTVTSFTYQDVLENRIEYLHDAGNSESDVFTFKVELDEVSLEEEFKIVVEASRDQQPPEIVHNRILRILALQTKAITAELLQVRHRGTAPEDITYVVTQLPDTGHLLANGKVYKPGEVPEFSQEDINNQVVQYASDSSGQLNDRLVFDVSTETQSLQQLEFLIEIIPLTLPHNEANVTVSEGGSVMLSLKTLALKGRLAQNRAVQFTLQHVPVHGKVVLRTGRKNEAQVGEFSYEDVSRRRLYYVHDGSESLTDEMTVKADSPDGSSVSQLSTLYMVVTPVDDQPPSVLVNTGLDLWTGSVALLTNAQLQASDPDTPSGQVKFHVSSPTNGHLAFLNNTLKPILEFTQRDIDSGHLVLVHTGKEQGEFTFEVTDGHNAGPQLVFRIRARPVQLEVKVNNTIHAFPNSLQPITNQSVLVRTSSENFSQPILFTMSSPRPRHGWLVIKIDRHLQDITSFTQQDIDEGKVFFKHTGQQTQWTEVEKLQFEISTMHAKPINNSVFVVESSFSNLNEDNFRSVFKMNTPVIDEGKKIVLSRSYFDASEMIEKISAVRPDVKVEFSIVKHVHSGYLTLNDESAELGDIFTQEDINRGRLLYKHDHSDTVWDLFQFAVKIIVPRSHSEHDTSSSHVFNFTIDIRPVNDQEFLIITRNPKLEVMQGSTVDITSQILTTVDLDTGPEGIEYVIEEQPFNGMIARKSRPYTKLETFTQKDINDGNLMFVHDGNREASSSVYFRVSDNLFPPRYGNIIITVRPLLITVSPASFVPLVQGSQSVTLSNHHLKVTTNGDRTALAYRITQMPQFGKLQYFGKSVVDFTQRDIDNGWVVYIQNPDSPGNDYFVLDIDLKGIDCNLDTVQYEVLMQPLVKVGPLLSSAGSQVIITRASLDVSELAQITNDTPKFKITSPPQHGQLMRKKRMRREVNPAGGEFHPVSNFTFDDILYSRLYYVAGRSGAEKDEFEYILSAKGVPPAKGKFHIQLQPGSTGDVDVGGSSETAPTSKPVQRGASNPREDESAKNDKGAVKGAAVHPDSGDDTKMIIIAVSVSLVLVIIIIVITILFFLRRRKRKRDEAVDSQEVHAFKPRPYISGPLQLEQPHVLIEPKQETSLTPGGGDDHSLMASTSLGGTSRGDNTYVNASMMGAELSAPLLNRASGSNLASPDTADISQTEDQERASIMTAGRDSNASADLTDWTLMDPDILQHCHTTTPVLRNKQHWF